VLDMSAQTRGAIIYGINIVLAAETLDNLFCDVGVRVGLTTLGVGGCRDIGEGAKIGAGILSVVICTPWSLKVEKPDEHIEDAKVGKEIKNSHHQQHPPLIGQRVLRGEQKVHGSGAKAEA